MLSELLLALRHGPNQVRYFRHTYSPFSPWKEAIDEVIREVREEARRYGVDAAVDRRRAYQVARMVVSNRTGDHLADLVPDAYLAYSPPSAASFHAGKSSYASPRERRDAFRKHPQTLAYLLTPPALCRAGIGGSPEGGLVVVGQDEEDVGPDAVVERLRAAAGARVADADLRAYAGTLLKLRAGLPAETEPEQEQAA